MEETCLNYTKLKHFIESSDNPEQERDNSLNYLKEIAADISPSYTKWTMNLLDIVFGYLYEKIEVTGNNELKELSKDNCVVLVPNHQSHIDYLVMSYKVFRKFNFLPYVAGGVNLNIFPIGKIFRKTGCFFIRRAFPKTGSYKIVMEAYLYYLLKNGKVLEFFFEGGRSRSGKLLPPRFGLFKMILDAYKELSKEVNKKLLFIPVAVLNEYVLEQKSLNLEIKGGKKKKESTKQLFSLFKIFSRKLGSIHLIFGKPVDSKDCKGTDLRTQSQDIAFQCFRTIGKNMKVTPSSLLSLVLLEEHEGVMKWTDIMLKARSVRWFCLEFNIPIIKSLQNEDEFEGVLGKAIDIMIANKK